jgi:predicted transglutaminase-like cysteine proteinase
MFNLIIDVCGSTGRIVDSSTIQILIVSIQCYKYLKAANINNGNNLKNDGYRTYRERYLDLCNIYETYDSFDEFVEYMKNKLNKLNIEVNDVFDVIKDNDTVTDEVKALLKFD